MVHVSYLRYLIAFIKLLQKLEGEFIETGISLRSEAESDTKCWPVKLEASGRAKVKLKWVRMHFEISGFSQGLQV